MPVEFLTDVQAGAYSRFTQPPSLAELEWFFFLDDTDMALVNKRRGDYNRLGFSLQLGTARLLGSFLVDPLDVPTEAVDFLAEQLGVADPSCLKAYGEREKTRLEHQWEITVELLWDAIESVVSRAELRTAVTNLTDVIPPPDAGGLTLGHNC